MGDEEANQSLPPRVLKALDVAPSRFMGQPKPAEADPNGAWSTFERGLSKTSGEKGWVDVWMGGRSGWEY